MKKICIIGCFADGLELLNGQTVKTKIVYNELGKKIGYDNIMKVDTYGKIKTLIKSPYMVLKALIKSKNIIILPAENGLRIIAPLLVIFNKIFKRKIYYDVIGGWLPEFISKNKWLNIYLKQINMIFVETNSMKKQLEDKEYNNVAVIFNCKELNIINQNEIKNTNTPPYKLCTFSRVMKEKGIEDAVKAVSEINLQNNEVFVTLDIYGQIDNNQSEWFEHLQSSFPKYIKYKGAVSFEQSTNVLKKYDALLFPTYYEGEGFAGTIIDAFAAGLPVIASNWKYNSEIIKSGQTGLIFEVHNIDELKNAITAIKYNPQRWNHMKENCVQEAKKYLPSTAMKKLVDLIINEGDKNND